MNKYQLRRIEFLRQIARAKDPTVECVYCGERRANRLTGGHIADDGAEHRRDLVGHLMGSARSGGGATGAFMRKLEQLGWPIADMRRMQVECFSCNNAKKSSLTDGDINDGLEERPEAGAEPAAREEATGHRSKLSARDLARFGGNS